LLERVDRKSDRKSTPSALAWLAGRRYSGNIRELRNLIERATLLADGDSIDRLHLMEMPEDIPPAPLDASGTFQLAELVALGTLEKRYLDWAMAHSQETTCRCWPSALASVS
jgi:DNA-binding NtrC family response regulator